MVNWTTGSITEDGYTAYALLPSDLTDGIHIGDLEDVRQAHAALTRLLETGQADEEIYEFHPQLHRWFSIREAAEKYNLPYTTLYSAIQRGEIDRAEQDGGQWYFPGNSIRKWMANRPKPGPKTSE